MTPHNHPANGSFHTPADIAVDNPPRDPQAVVKRKVGRQRILTDDARLQKRRALRRRWYAANRAAILEYQRQWRADNADVCRERVRTAAKRPATAWQRLKRIAAARGVSPEQLLDEMERG